MTHNINSSSFFQLFIFLSHDIKDIKLLDIRIQSFINQTIYVKKKPQQTITNNPNFLIMKDNGDEGW